MPSLEKLVVVWPRVVHIIRIGKANILHLGFQMGLT